MVKHLPEQSTSPAPGPVGVGTEFKSGESIPIEFVSFARITALDEPTRIAWESTDHQVFRTEWEFAISPVAGGTHLVQRVTFHPISALQRILAVS